ncbi:hypothetical protein EST92_05740 [Streptomyces sp. TM32]|nr:hypothetical protein EST92_05740 [Streptomyces sp. TM32]
MSSWQAGVDLSALAAELGLDVRILVARAQQLSAESRPAPPPDRIGRHRRLVNVPPPSPHSETPPPAWRERPPQPPREHYEQEPWKQHPYQNYPEQQEYQEYRVYEQHPQQHHYQQPSQGTWDANAITAAQHDWDGILSQWEATTSTTPPISPGHTGT